MNKDIKEQLLNSSHPLRAEKDFLECLILDCLFNDSDIFNTCVLAGSGSITKAYKMGKRIGNDIDLAYHAFGELPCSRSVKQLNKYKKQFKNFVFDELKEKVVNAVKDIGMFRVMTDKELRNQSVKYCIETGLHSSSELHLLYTSNLKSYYQGRISIEFIPRKYSANIIELRPVCPHIVAGRGCKTSIPTVKYSQTFWDKCYALHVISQLGMMRSGLAHHYYDVGYLSDFVDIENTVTCLDSVAKYQETYTTRTVQQPASLHDIQLVPDNSTLQKLSQDYKSLYPTFVEKPESWDVVVTKIRQLNDKMHELGR